MEFYKTYVEFVLENCLPVFNHYICEQNLDKNTWAGIIERYQPEARKQAGRGGGKNCPPQTMRKKTLFDQPSPCADLIKSL